jgi:acyl carrier protein
VLHKILPIRFGCHPHFLPGSPIYGERAQAAPAPPLRLQIRRDTSRVLRLDDSEIPGNKPLNELGLDSLMAIDLRNTLGRTLGRNLAATLLFDYPTVDALAAYLTRTVSALDDSSVVSDRPLNSQPRGTHLLDQIENLDDDEIDRLLKAKGEETH